MRHGLPEIVRAFKTFSARRINALQGTAGALSQRVRIIVGAGLKPSGPVDQVVDQVGAGLKPAPTMRHGLPEIVRAFKTFSARRINALQGTAGALSQRVRLIAEFARIAVADV